MMETKVNNGANAQDALDIIASYENEIKQFLNVYGLELADYVQSVKKQFKNIVTQTRYIAEGRRGYEWKRNDWDVDIRVVPDRTKVEAKSSKDFTQYTLYISYGDVLSVYENSDMDLFESFCKLVTHEYMHFLMKHLDPEMGPNMHDFALGKPRSLHKHIGTQMLLMFMVTPGKADTMNKSFDPAMGNIAYDFAVNNAIDMRYPAIRASDFGLPEGLPEVAYYSIVYHLMNSYPKERLSNSFFTSEGVNNFLSDHYKPCREKIREIYEDLTGGQGDVNETLAYKPHWGALHDIMEQSKLSSLQGNIPAMANKMQIAKTGIWKSMHDLLAELTRQRQHYKLSLVEKRDNWCKFNNRKDGTFLYPGKQEIRGAVERKIDQHPVLFVDVSGSMQSVIEPLFTFCWFALSKLQMEVVFYDTEIKAIFNSENALKLEAFVCGGTNCKSAVYQYEKAFKRPSSLTILSDCEDWTLPQLKSEWGDQCNVWKMQNTGLFKLF